MSNIHSQNDTNDNKKIIGIKPVDFFLKEKARSPKTSMTEYEQIQADIAEAKQTLSDLTEKQQTLLQTTKVEIEKERNDWQEEKGKWIEQAKEEGYAAGFASGKEESQRAYKSNLEQANSIVHQATNDYHSELEKSEETIVELSILIAEKIIKQKIEQEPSNFLSLVKAAIKEIENHSTVSIYAHPNNYEMIMEQKDELIQLLGTDTKLSVYVKDELTENACVIEHPFGKIDASVDTQLEQIRNKLLELAEERNE